MAMVELSKERLEQILHEETIKKEESDTILRSIYTRYMCLYEKYFADIDALNDDVIAELRKYHEETGSLVKYCYMDIPMDICTCLREFEDRYSSKLLGPEWHEVLFDYYEKFKEERTTGDESEEALKAEYTRQMLAAFYDAMDYIFRDGFGTGSHTAKRAINGLKELLFGKE
ncbi:MAG: hypothetical protein Q4E38_04020 [Eubacteriales bacterium]|nr:hypothetical protein [Eubacteriales bacterium]